MFVIKTIKVSALKYYYDKYDIKQLTWASPCHLGQLTWASHKYHYYKSLTMAFFFKSSLLVIDVYASYSNYDQCRNIVLTIIFVSV